VELAHEIVEIEGTTYKIVQRPAAVCFHNSTRVLGHVSAAAEQLRGLSIAGLGLGQLLNADIAIGGAALKAVCDRLHPAEMEYLSELVFKDSSIEIDGKHKPLLTHLKVNAVPGGVVTLFQLLWVGLRLSFGPFGSLASLFPAPAAAGDSKVSTG
jgi:hypothetical protein